MGIAQYDPTALGRPVWNAGRTVGVKKPLKQRRIWAIRFFLDREGRMRDRALFDLAIDSKLRGCDLVKMKIGSLVTGTEIRTRGMVVQQKTGRPVRFEITADVRASLLAWLERRGGTTRSVSFFQSRLSALKRLSGIARLRENHAVQASPHIFRSTNETVSTSNRIACGNASLRRLLNQSITTPARGLVGPESISPRQTFQTFPGRDNSRWACLPASFHRSSSPGSPRRRMNREMLLAVCLPCPDVLAPQPE